MTAALEQIVINQRKFLARKLAMPMRESTRDMALHMGDRAELEHLLAAASDRMTYSKHLYVLDAGGVQLTSNIQRDGADASHFGRERADRPYMENMFGDTDFRLSEAYISKNRKTPSLTAVHTIRDDDGTRLGFLGIDFDLRELPHPDVLYKETRDWRQIKGDPAIRGGLFLQKRVHSVMDERIDDVFALLDELIQQHGVFHGKLHFSSSRATIWLASDPYNYRLLTIEDLVDPDICLAYPRRPLFDKATVPPAAIMKVFGRFRELRFGDETLYLRAGSLNMVNGLVGLNFSCDGSHYMHFEEFLSKGADFWFGDTACVEAVTEDAEVHRYLEEIGQVGCTHVRSVIGRLDKGETLPELGNLSGAQQVMLLDELKSIIAVYDAE